MVAPEAALSVTMNVSCGSGVRSPSTPIGTVAVVCPAGIITGYVVAAKSKTDVAVPPAVVAAITVTSDDDGFDSVTLKFALVVASWPSATYVSAMLSTGGGPTAPVAVTV